MKEGFQRLQQRINVTFRDPGLLKQAFTHTSYVNEQRGARIPDNERLEFLGDAVLQLTVSEYLYRLYPDSPEGELTRLRASIVCEPSGVRARNSVVRFMPRAPSCRKFCRAVRRTRWR